MRVRLSCVIISPSRSSSCIFPAMMHSTVVAVGYERPKVCLQLRFLASTTSEESRRYQLKHRLV
jgi:hypothetical protein